MQRLARGYLIVVSVLNGLSGLVCGTLFLIAPDGRLLQAGALLPVIRKLPLAAVFFQNFVWIGIAMLLVLGVPNTVAAFMLIRRSARQYEMAMVAAVLLAAWTGFELVFMYNAPALGYFLVGAVSIVACLSVMRRGSASQR